MTPGQALERRQQRLRDGFCVVDDILGNAFLRELRCDHNQVALLREPKHAILLHLANRAIFIMDKQSG